MNSKIKPFLLCIILSFALGACATGKEQKFVNAEQYFKVGQHYTYAIYNSDNLLISHPHEVWFKASKDAQLHGKPYTDLYIISHGWNFTHQEAIANFQQYMKIWDKKEYNPKFWPYIIFVVWNSTSRPITDSVGAVLPFGLDKSLDKITKPADVSIHIVTGWKQSINAEHIALGNRLPSEYENEQYPSIEIDEKNDIGGKDIPLSMVLYEIIKSNNSKKYTLQKIHLVGHSYGAKLISLASLETLHRIYPEKTDEPSGMDENPSPPATTFESLVLINAAFAPDELNYFYDVERMEPKHIHSLWTRIPRKALVYSNTDLATGVLFNTGQIIFNTHLGQFFDSTLRLPSPFDTRSTSELNTSDSSVWSKTLEYLQELSNDTVDFINGTTAVATNLIFSPALWAIETTLKLPADLLYHVANNDTFGKNPSLKFLNIPHFFLPIDKMRTFDFGLDLGWGQHNFSDHQGLWRGTIPAIGRTGLYRLRRWNSGVFETFVENDEKNKEESADINADEFKSIACSIYGQPNEYKNGDLFYSFDGSKVYNSWFSHGDLREKEPAKACENDEDEEIIQKREATFNFITKFTLGPKSYPYIKK